MAACSAEELAGPDAGEHELVEEEDFCVTCDEPFMIPGEEVNVLVTLEDRREYRLETSCEGIPCEVQLEPNNGDVGPGRGTSGSAGSARVTHRSRTR